MCFLRSSGVRHRKWKLLGVKLPDFTVGMLSHCMGVLFTEKIGMWLDTEKII